MGDESGESTKEDELTGEEGSESEMERLIRRCRREVGTWFQGQCV